MSANDILQSIEWETLPAAAEKLGIDYTVVRRLIREGVLVAVKPAPDKPLSLPADFLLPADHPHANSATGPADHTEPTHGYLNALRGTITLLRDQNLTDEEIVVWLFSPNDHLDGNAVETLRAGHKAVVRRAAQMIY